MNSNRSFISRRTLLGGLALTFAADRGWAAEQPLVLANADFRGSLDASHFGIQPGDADQSAKAFNAMLQEAANRDQPVFLPPGTYRLSNIILPTNCRLTGVPGLTRIHYSGDGAFLTANGGKRITLSGLSIDGANRWLADDQPGLLTFRDVDTLDLTDNEITGAARNALSLEKCGGRLGSNRISGAADAGIYAVESRSLTIKDNWIADCADGGILVHRWSNATDGSVISGNRITGIGARSGGTGQYGNGINVFRAGNVQVSNNHISDCAFTAIRANSASNIQITANQCLGSGETAIYSEFAFEGAMITDNLIDGAANGIASVNFNEGGRLSLINSNIIRNLRLTAPYEMDGNYFGIGLSAEADTVVADNLIENAPRWGMVLGWGPYLRNVSVTGNIIRKAGVGCAVSVVEGAGSALISNNLFSDMVEAAIAGFRWQERASGDLISSGATAFPHLTLTGNRAA